LGNGTAGATINGAGTLYNQSGAVIQGGGTISAAISNLGTITANNSSAALVLKGNIDTGTGPGTIISRVIWHGVARRPASRIPEGATLEPRPGHYQTGESIPDGRVIRKCRS
jgi:hypothetical protein